MIKKLDIEFLRYSEREVAFRPKNFCLPIHISCFGTHSLPAAMLPLDEIRLGVISWEDRDKVYRRTPNSARGWVRGCQKEKDEIKRLSQKKSARKDFFHRDLPAPSLPPKFDDFNFKRTFNCVAPRFK